jgi:hypothetical protein
LLNARAGVAGMILAANGGVRVAWCCNVSVSHAEKPATPAIACRLSNTSPGEPSGALDGPIHITTALFTTKGDG